MRLAFRLFGFDVHLEVRRHREWAYFRDALQRGEAIVCISRCLYCQRPTPHEVCHAHSEALHPGWWDALEAAGGDIDAIWGTGADLEPETCADPACPVWAPEEAEALRARQEKETVIIP